jgi:ABC-2 type transport system permease protein
MRRLLWYLRTYREFLATSAAEAMSYRAHFVLLMVMELTFYATSLAGVDLIYGHVERIGVWRRDEFLFFLSYMLAVDELHMTLVSESFWILSDDIRTGTLDQKLLKPLSLFFTIFFRHIRVASFLMMPVSWGLLLYFGTRAGLPWWGWLAIPPLLLLSFALLVAIEVLVSTAMFVTIDGTGINFLRMQMQQVSRWPDFVFSPLPRRVMTVAVPLLVIGNAPVRFLFDPGDTALLLWMVPALGVVLALNSWLWRRALRGYSSASS